MLTLVLSVSSVASGNVNLVFAAKKHKSSSSELNDKSSLSSNSNNGGSSDGGNEQQSQQQRGGGDTSSSSSNGGGGDSSSDNTGGETSITTEGSDNSNNGGDTGSTSIAPPVKEGGNTADTPPASTEETTSSLSPSTEQTQLSAPLPSTQQPCPDGSAPDSNGNCPTTTPTSTQDQQQLLQQSAGNDNTNVGAGGIRKGLISPVNHTTADTQSIQSQSKFDAGKLAGTTIQDIPFSDKNIVGAKTPGAIGSEARMRSALLSELQTGLPKDTTTQKTSDTLISGLRSVPGGSVPLHDPALVPGPDEEGAAPKEGEDQCITIPSKVCNFPYPISQDEICRNGIDDNHNGKVDEVQCSEVPGESKPIPPNDDVLVPTPSQGPSPFGPPQN